MTPMQYECALLAFTSWRGAKSDNIDEILAVACTLRNRVHRYGKTYSDICEDCIVNRVEYPDIRHPLLIDPNNGVLMKMEDIYKNILPDLTSNHLHKNGAMFFARAVEHQGTGDWFETEILMKPEEHGLIGSWGTQSFYE